MPAVEINGGNVVYEILGDSGDLVVLTPGGRFSKDVPGLRPLADALVAGGYRVLLWDRPNCGMSDVQFYGRTESHMRADTLKLLLDSLSVGPVLVAGGSGGARDSIVFSILYPEMVTKLAVWNIVGGIVGSMALASYYVLPSMIAVRRTGVEALPNVEAWKSLIEANPDNEKRLLSLDRDEFMKTAHAWLNAYVPKPGYTIPGVEDADFDRITMPTLIIRGGADDYDHPKRTSLEVHCLIRGSELIEPPWPEDAWERAQEDMARGRAGFILFDTWVQAAPPILEFFGR